METTIHPARCLSGSLTVPGDKSVAHRALTFGALGRGQQKIHNLPPSEDVASTTACLRALGVRIEGHAEGEVRVAPGAWVRGHTLNAATPERRPGFWPAWPRGSTWGAPSPGTTPCGGVRWGASRDR